ncbi:MAG: hypothetical protein ACREIT_08395 [Tepidisphaeraceae bacterium]
MASGWFMTCRTGSSGAALDERSKDALATSIPRNEDVDMDMDMRNPILANASAEARATVRDHDTMLVTAQALHDTLVIEGPDVPAASRDAPLRSGASREDSFR